MRLALSLLAVFFAGIIGNGADRVIKIGPFGSFSSPNYPKEYGNDARKEWLIQVQKGYHIKIRFTSFDLEDSYDEEEGPCVYDYVLITEGSETIGRFCGNTEQYPWDAPRKYRWYRSKGNVVLVVFVSDYSNEGFTSTGFSAHYVAEDNDECAEMRHKVRYTIEDWDELVVCNHYCHNVPASYYCSCRTGYRLHSNQHTCIAVDNCIDQELDEDSGVIESPEYPNPYAKLSNCSWHIKVEDGLSIHLTFDNLFDVEEHEEEGCVYDILEIYNRTGRRYCGSTAPNSGQTMNMNTRDVKISFTTDLSIEKKGFRIIYNTTGSSCQQNLRNPTHGSIATANPKGYYQFRDVVVFQCDKGYNLKGAERLECLSDGSWDNRQPTCKIKSCGSPDHLTSIKNSHIIDLEKKRFKYLERITVECDKWYEMTNGSATWKCDDSMEWVRDSTPVHPNPPFDYPNCRPKCGIKGPSKRSIIRAQIFGGVESSKHEWPWMVFLDFEERNLADIGGPSCGGSLISPKYVLTAAHCVNSTRYIGNIRWANETHVWLGVHHREDRDSSEVKYAEAEKIIIHPEYHKSSMWNYDVALIRLRETVVMGEAIRPVCLPSTKEEFDSVDGDGSGEVAGWGMYGNLQISSLKLLQAQFPIVSRKKCLASYTSRSNISDLDLPQNFNLTENMFCAGRFLGTQTTCYGDSGGPFVMKKKKSATYFVAGLVSFGSGEGCGKFISYTGFARLNEDVVEWIMKETNYLE